MRIDCNRKRFVDLCTKHEGELEGSHDTRKRKNKWKQHEKGRGKRYFVFMVFDENRFFMVKALEARICRSVIFVVFRLALALISFTDFGSRKLS